MLFIAIFVLIVIFFFELVMFISALTNGAISKTAKIWWVIGMLLIHPFVAIVYYFTDHKKRA